MSNKKLPQVKQPEPPNPEIPVEVLAQAIVDLSAAFKKVQNGPLSQRALVLLIQDATSPKVSQDDIKRVLNVLPELENIFVRKEPAR